MSTPRRSPDAPVTLFGPDFPFAFDDWIAHPAGLGEQVSQSRHGCSFSGPSGMGRCPR